LQTAVKSELDGVATALWALAAVIVAIYVVPPVLRFVRSMLH
jgi:hypothetical protein